MRCIGLLAYDSVRDPGGRMGVDWMWWRSVGVLDKTQQAGSPLGAHLSAEVSAGSVLGGVDRAKNRLPDRAELKTSC